MNYGNSFDRNQTKLLNDQFDAIEKKIDAIMAYIALLPGAPDVDLEDAAKALKSYRGEIHSARGNLHITDTTLNSIKLLSEKK